MDPRGQGPGSGGEGDGRAEGRGRAQILRNLSLRRPGQSDVDSSMTSQSVSTTAGRGLLLRGLSADSTISTQESSVSAGRGALIRNLSTVGGASQVSSSVASARQEMLAKLQKKKETAAAVSAVPKPIGRAGLVSSFRTQLLLKF